MVTDDDVRDFMSVRLSAAATVPLQVKISGFSGYTAQYVKAGHFWKEWWLRAGQLLIYATYNDPLGREESEIQEVEHILHSLNRLD